LGLTLGVDGLHVPALRATGPILEGDVEALACACEDPRQSPHAVVEQRVIGGIVDVGPDDGGIDAHRAAVLDAHGFGMANDQVVDIRPGLGRDALDVVGKRRLARNREVREAANRM
jgi:hypothetical protein